MVGRRPLRGVILPRLGVSRVPGPAPLLGFLHRMHDSCAVGSRKGRFVGGSWSVPGAAPGLFVLGEQRLLRPDEQVFEAMLAGWRDQQLCRNLGEATVRRRLEGGGVSSGSPTTGRGGGGRRIWKSSPRSCAASGGHGRRSGPTTVICACSASTPPTRATSGPRCASGCSAPTRRRSASSGTPPCTPRTTRASPAGGR